MSTWKVIGIAGGVSIVAVLAGEFAGSRGWLDWLHPGALAAMRAADGILGAGSVGLSESHPEEE
jgi:hypothetical protein